MLHIILINLVISNKSKPNPLGCKEFYKTSTIRIFFLFACLFVGFKNMNHPDSCNSQFQSLWSILGVTLGWHTYPRSYKRLYLTVLSQPRQQDQRKPSEEPSY